MPSYGLPLPSLLCGYFLIVIMWRLTMSWKLAPDQSE